MNEPLNAAHPAQQPMPQGQLSPSEPQLQVPEMQAVQPEQTVVQPEQPPVQPMQQSGIDSTEQAAAVAQAPLQQEQPAAAQAPQASAQAEEQAITAADVAKYQSFQKSQQTRVVWFVAVIAIIALILAGMWFLLPDTRSLNEYDGPGAPSTFVAEAPVSYDAVYEVFAAARARMVAGGSEDADGEGHYEEYFDEGVEGGIEGDVGEDYDDYDNGTLPGGVIDPETGEEFELDEFYDDEAALAEAEGLDEYDDYIDDEYFDDDYYDDNYYAEDDEYFDDDEDFTEDGEDYDEYYGDAQNLMIAFSEDELDALSDQSAQNPASAVDVTLEGKSYRLQVTKTGVRINELSEDGRVGDEVGMITSEAANDGGGDSESTAHTYYASLFFAEGRLIVLSTTMPEEEWDEEYDEAAEAEADADIAADADTATPDETSDSNSELTLAAFTTLRIFDLAEPANPELLSEYLITGNYSGSRMLGTQLSIATDYGIYDLDQVRQEAPETFIPFVEHQGERSLVQPEMIRISSDIDVRDMIYTQIVNIDISGDTQLSSQLALLGGPDEIHADAEHIYLVNLTFVDENEIRSAILPVILQEAVLSFGEIKTIDGVFGESDEGNDEDIEAEESVP